MHYTAGMLVLPFQISRTEYSIFVALPQDSIDRMRAYDPAEVTIAKLGGRYADLKLKDLIIGYATADDEKAVMKIIREENDPRKALKFLTRGFRYRPDMGDHDKSYEPLAHGATDTPINESTNGDAANGKAG